jgi:hypothetical protein
LAWEDRKGNSYYYSAQRIGGRVRKLYLGRGSMAGRMASAESSARRRREEEMEAWTAERERLGALVALIGELCEAVEVLTRAHLIANGYHQVKGQWRRRRARDPNR